MAAPAAQSRPMPELLLIRHCQSAGQAPDAPLTDVGRAQAEALATHLLSHPIDRIVSSPYLRARETIAPFAGRTRRAVDFDERLAERRLSPVPIENWREVARASFDDLDLRAPGGESGRETLARGWAAIEAVLARGDQLPALVTHGQLMSLVLHSIDPGFGYVGWEALSNPDVYLVESGAAGYRFKRVWE